MMYLLGLCLEVGEYRRTKKEHGNWENLWNRTEPQIGLDERAFSYNMWNYPKYPKFSFHFPNNVVYIRSVKCILKNLFSTQKQEQRRRQWSFASRAGFRSRRIIVSVFASAKFFKMNFRLRVLIEGNFWTSPFRTHLIFLTLLTTVLSCDFLCSWIKDFSNV